VLVRSFRQEKLDGDVLLERKVRCRDDDAHPALAERSLDAVLAGNDGARHRLETCPTTWRPGWSFALGWKH
jgi:hypothetical protein